MKPVACAKDPATAGLDSPEGEKAALAAAVDGAAMNASVRARRPR